MVMHAIQRMGLITTVWPTLHPILNFSIGKMLNLEYFVTEEPIKFFLTLFDGRLLADVQFVASMDNFVKESHLEFLSAPE